MKKVKEMDYYEINDLYSNQDINYVENKYSVYVIDTNIIIDYPHIIPSTIGWENIHSSIDFNGSHLVIPETVILELDSFKHESSTRGEIARTVLFNLRKIFESVSSETKDLTSHRLKSAIYFEKQNRLLTVTPHVCNFTHQIFSPKPEDIDGQILLATLEVLHFTKANRVEAGDWSSFNEDCVTLLTNDNTMAIRAHSIGIRTSNLHYDTKACYSGRRSVTVPNSFFELFTYEKEGVELSEWLKNMPNETALTANEFIIMTPEDPSYLYSYRPYYNIGRFDNSLQKIVHLTYFQNLNVTPKNDGQAIYAESIAHPEIQTVIVTGPAGSGKTFIPTIGGIEACKTGQFLGITIVPCSVGVQKELGALPGNLDEKISPNIAPIKNAILNYCKYADKDIAKAIKNFRTYGIQQSSSKESKKGSTTKIDYRIDPLCWTYTTQFSNKERRMQKTIKHRLKDCVDMIYNNWFDNIPVEAARGLDFSDEFVIYDEFQDQSISQADMLLKRTGKNCKLIISGDINQIHQDGLNRYNNGISYTKRICHGLPMVALVTLTPDEVIRSEMVQMIAKRQHSE